MEVKVIEKFSVSADRIWDLLSDFGGILRWNESGIDAVVVDGEGVGAVRTISIPGGRQLQEKLEAHDDDARSFSYSFTGKLLLPLENYYATMTVNSLGGESCEVVWDSTFGAGPLPEDQAKEIVKGIYDSGLAALRKTVEP